MLLEMVGAVDFVDPPSGTVIANFEGTENVTTLTCNVTNPNNGNQIGTRWSIENFRNVSELQIINTIDERTASLFFLISGDQRPTNPSITFVNRLTILNLTSGLDGATVYCGIGEDLRQANFTLRVYRKLVETDSSGQLRIAQ